MNVDINSWVYIILFGQVTINLLIFILFISSQRAKKSSSEESRLLRDEIERLNSRLSDKEVEISDLLTQKSASDAELRKILEDKTSLQQEYEKRLQDPIRKKELEIIREENQKLSSRLAAKEQELSKVLTQKAAAEEAFKKAAEDKGVIKQEYEKELQGTVDRKEFERLQAENQKLSSQAVAQEAELSKISAQKTALEEAVKRATEEESNLKREYEVKLEGLADRKELERLQEENKRLNLLATSKEQELLKTQALKAAVEAAFREISSQKAVLDKEEEKRAKKLLGPEVLERFQKEEERLNTQILAKDKELAELKTQNSTNQEELKKAKADLEAEKQKLEQLVAAEKAQTQEKEKQIQGTKDELRALQEKLGQLNQEVAAKQKELSEALAQKSKAEEEAKQAAEEKTSLKQEYEKKMQDSVDRKEFERLREENQKLNTELIAKEEELASAPEAKKIAGKKSAKAGKDLEAAETAKTKGQAGPKEAPEAEKGGKIKGGPPPKVPAFEPSLAITGDLPKDLIPYVQEQEKKIGELLLSNGLIDESLWQKAINYQKQHKGSSPILYLIAYGHLKEDQLAESLCDYFKIPYLPLSKYEIPDEIIQAIPQDIIEQHLCVPVFKSGNIINVVMANPFDARAIKAIEDTTGLKVRPFVGLFSEIIATLKIYVRLPSEGSEKYPFFVETKTYTGLERRESVRIDAALDIEYLAEGGYKRTVTKNVSRAGFCFEADISLPVGSIFPLMVYLPVHINPLPIKVITKVVKTIPLADNKFEIRLNTIKVDKQDLNKIIEFASQSKGKQSGK